MTTNYKILGQTRPAANTDTNNYSVPENNSALVKSININNTSSSADTYSIAFLDSAEPVEQSYVVFQKPFSNRVQISTDLLTWTNASMPAPADWSSVTYGPLGWLASGYDMTSGGILAKTTDLSSEVWTPTGGGSFGATNSIAGSFYANGRYYVHTNVEIHSSTDLITWTNYSPYMMNDGVVGSQSVAYGNGKIVAVPGASGAVWHSTDGFTWGSSSPAFSSASPDKISFVNNKFVISAYSFMGGSDEVAVSTDGVSWTISTIGYSSLWRSRVAYGNGKYVIAAYTSSDADTTPRIAASTDLITWTVSTLPTDVTPGTYNKNIAFVNNNFVISGEMSGAYYKSTDAVTWTTQLAIDGMMDGIAWENAASANIITAPVPQSSDYIAYNVNVEGNETITIKSGYSLSENNAIFVKSTNGTTSFSTFGAEIS